VCVCVCVCVCTCACARVVVTAWRPVRLAVRVPVNVVCAEGIGMQCGHESALARVKQVINTITPKAYATTSTVYLGKHRCVSSGREIDLESMLPRTCTASGSTLIYRSTTVLVITSG
jgi:hypothetical protein